MTRLMGVQIINGYSSEARVFSSLIAKCFPTDLETQVFFNHWEGGPEDARRFQQDVSAKVVPVDFGWRSMSPARNMQSRFMARLKFFRVLPEVLAQAREFNPDVIYSSQQFWDCQVATYLAQRLQRPQIIHLHYTVGPYLHAPVLKRLLTCDHIITVSDYIRQDALRHGVAPTKISVLLNSADIKVMPPETRLKVRHELNLSPTAPVLACIARVDKDKGQIDTLQAFAHISPFYPEARLLIVGTDSPWSIGFTEKVKAVAADLKIEDKVQFLGQRSDVPQLLAAIDIFVHPARRDPCPLAPLEAAAAGLPIIAYADGGIIECVRDGRTALLAPTGDIAQLAHYMERLIASPEEAQRMGQAGKQLMEAELQPVQRFEKFMDIVQRISRSDAITNRKFLQPKDRDSNLI